MSDKELIVINARVYTGDEASPWAESFAVSDGRIAAVGTEESSRAAVGASAVIVDAEGKLVIPGLCDVHTHLGLGGGQAAWELPIAPTATVDEICAAVAEWASPLGPDEWIVGGIVGSTVLDVVANAESLARLDAAGGGRPVLLRDDSMHNRWVNSAALTAMGVDADSPDPKGGTYVRDEDGVLTGVLWEMASSEAEAAFASSIVDPAERMRVSLRTAAELCNRFGITTVQEAATMQGTLEGLAHLDKDGELSLRVVTSTPMREFLEPGTTGVPLVECSEQYRSENIRPDFVKVVLDGVPMTRTSAMLAPYLSANCCDPDHLGESLFVLDELVDTLEAAVSRGRSAKIHATGDASTRLALDAIEEIRRRHGDGPIFHIAHTEFIAESDLARFADLNVVADASPYIWYPSVIQESIAKQIPAPVVESSWPLRDLVSLGVNVSAGSDWPCALPSPDPWTGFEALVTRKAPDATSDEALNPSQSLTRAEALAAFTINPAAAMGLSEVVGSIQVGKAADFLVLDRNLFEIAETDIHNTEVLQTYLGGELVYTA